MAQENRVPQSRDKPIAEAVPAEAHSAENDVKIRSDHRQALYTLRRTQSAYSHFVPKDLLKLIGTSDILDVNLGDEAECKTTLMFADIRDFTSLSEGMTSHDTFALLNSYLGHMEPAIHRNGGIIDKFIGDAIMAVFPGGADSAIDAALAMRTALNFHNEQRKRDGLRPIKIGIGLNTGLSTLGVVGYLERMEATVIGDAVNVASRIEGLTKDYGVGVAISEDTFANLRNPEEHSIRFIDRTRVKGRFRPVSVYEVFDGDEPDLARQKLSTLETFEKAVAYYHLREIDRALPLFEQCVAEAPGDSVSGIYLGRCKTFDQSVDGEELSDLLKDIEWRDSFDTGLEDVDQQHRTLLENINKLAHAIQQEDLNGRVVAEVFAFLESYGVEHFKTEEAYMERYGYPFLDDHRQEHQAFIRNFLSTRREIESGLHDKLTALFHINVFLYDWLISHSTRIDKHFSDFVLQRMKAGAV